jgi:hypothetical protein
LTHHLNRFFHLLFFLVGIVMPALLPAGGTVDMASLYCPKTGEAADWRLSGETQQFEGDDLFLLINGGAEIYHEYGFVRVLAAVFQNGDGKKLNLEIYQMEDDASAYGIYSFKTAPGGTVVDSGDEALLEDYYLNMWRGHFLVTIIGFDSTQETVAGLATMAAAVAGKLKRAGVKPPVVSLLPQAGLQPGAITYLEGPLGFYNRYNIDPEDILGIRQAVFGQYGDAFVLVVQYSDPRQRGKWFQKAQTCIKKNTQVKDFKQNENIVLFIDPRGQLTTIKGFGNYIFLSNGFPKAMVAPMYASVEKKIREGSR